jgi:hypothetical protein
MNANLAKGAAAVGAVAVLVFGAAAISGADNSTTTTAAPNGFGGGAPPQVQGGQAPQQGQLPGGGPPGMGADVTGTTADKVAKAAKAKYPGQIERVQKLPDGSYVAHVITSSGEVHVHVSSAFKVLGTADFGGRGGPGAAAPQAPATSSSSGTTI